MNISMYQASVPRLANVLGNLSGILDKAQAHLDARGIDVAALMGARIALDMYPFSKQVQIACDKSRSVVARLAGLDVPHYVDDERTLGELKVRIERTIAFIRSNDAVGDTGEDLSDRLWYEAIRGLVDGVGSFEDSPLTLAQRILANPIDATLSLSLQQGEDDS